MFRTYIGRFHPFTGHEVPQGMQGYSYTLFQTSVLEGGEGSASRPGRTLPPGKTRYPLYRRLGGPQGKYGLVRKISPHRDSITGPSSPQAVAIPTTLPGPQNVYWNQISVLDKACSDLRMPKSLQVISQVNAKNIQFVKWEHIVTCDNRVLQAISFISLQAGALLKQQ